MAEQNDAVESLRAIAGKTSTRVLTTSQVTQDLEEYMGIFLDAVREVDPLMMFSVVDISRWAVKYEHTRGEKVPDVMHSTRSMGKYLAQNPESYGVECVGSYGNRSVYRLRTITGDHTQEEKGNE